MARLPRIFATVLPAQEIPEARISATAALAPLQAREQAFAQMARFGGQLTQRGVEAIQHKRKAAQETEARALYSEAAVRVNELQEELRLRPDPFNHASEFSTRFQQILTETEAQTQDEEIRRYLRDRMQTLFVERQHQARQFENRTFIDAENAKRLTTRQRLERLVIQSRTPQEAAVHFKEIVTGELAAAQRGEQTSVQAEQNILASVKRLALADIDADPTGALGRLERREGIYRQLEEDDRAQLVRQARNEEREQVNRRLEFDRGMAAQAKEELERLRGMDKAEQEAIERDIVFGLRDGTLTDARLRQLAPKITSEKLEAYFKALDETALEGPPSDPRVLTRLENLVWSITTDAAAAENQVDRAYRRNEIQRKHWLRMKAHLQVLGRQQKEARDPFIARRHQQVEENLGDFLRTQSSLSPEFDQISQEVLAQAKRDLASRSAYFQDGGIDPFDWERQHLERYIALAGGRAATRLGVLKLRLRADIRPERLDIEGLRDATRKLMAAKETFGSEDAFWDQVRQLRDMEKLLNEVNQLRVRPPAPPSERPGTMRPPAASVPAGPLPAEPAAPRRLGR